MITLLGNRRLLRFPHGQSGDWVTPIDARHPVLAEVFARHGYVTAGFVANYAFGQADYGLGRGFLHYEDDQTSLTMAMRTTSLGFTLVKALKLRERRETRVYFDWKTAAKVNLDFLCWLSNREDGRPYFVFLNYFDAQSPYLPPPEFGRKFSSRVARGDIWSKDLDAWSPEEIREFNDAYDGTILYLDHHLAQLFDELCRGGGAAAGGCRERRFRQPGPLSLLCSSIRNR